MKPVYLFLLVTLVVIALAGTEVSAKGCNVQKCLGECQKKGKMGGRCRNDECSCVGESEAKAAGCDMQKCLEQCQEKGINSAGCSEGKCTCPGE